MGDSVSSSRSPVGSSEMVLMAQVARRYFLGEQSKVQIAADLGLSRYRVARLIRAGLDRGIVRIDVGIPGDVDLGMSAELRDAYGLTHCIVVNPPDEDEATLRRYVGLTTTELLAEIVGPHDVLGIASTRVLMGLPELTTRFAGCPVVQISGAISRPDASDVLEAVRRFTRTGGGPTYVFYAPLICHDAGAWMTYQHQPEVARCWQLFGDVTVAVVGVGAWRPGLSTVYDALPPKDRLVCQDLGVAGEIAGILVGEDGTTVPTPLSERLIGMTEAQLRAVPTRIGATFGVGRADAVRTVLTSHMINSLVTHRSLAQAILNGH